MGVWIRTQNRGKLIEIATLGIMIDGKIKGIDVRGTAVTLRNL